MRLWLLVHWRYGYDAPSAERVFGLRLCSYFISIPHISKAFGVANQTFFSSYAFRYSYSSCYALLLHSLCPRPFSHDADVYC
jgi:hypothetical protein